MNRRELLKFGAASLVASQLPLSLRGAGNQAWAGVMNAGNSDSPLVAFSGEFANAKWMGDNEDMPHEILWNKAGFISKLGGLPKPTLSTDLIVIGGGLSGLIAAYRASHKDVIVLEQDPRFGGNSKGEIFKAEGGARMFSQGAAYICKPEPGDASDQLLKDLSLNNAGRVEVGAPYLLGSLLNDDLWTSTAKSSAIQDLRRVESRLREIFETEFPDIPLSGDKALDEKTRALDSISFEVWLKKEFGELDPFVLEYLQMYAWSSFDASIEELSAAQALNFIAGEVDGVFALPGGNASIAQRLYAALVARYGRDAVRANSFVVDVKVLSDRVIVSTFENGKIVTIEAKQALFAAPKFLAKTLIDDLAPALAKSFGDLVYRSYLVANVRLKTNGVSITPPHYDVFRLESAPADAPSAMKPSSRPYTDVVFADWAKAQSVADPILTVYRPLPADGARQFLFAETAFDKHKAAVTAGLGPLLQSIGLSTNAIDSVRLSRWGHAVPLARKGYIASGNPQTIESAYGNRLQFIGQDVWANAAFETALATAERAVARL